MSSETNRQNWALAQCEAQGLRMTEARRKIVAFLEGIEGLLVENEVEISLEERLGPLAHLPERCTGHALVAGNAGHRARPGSHQEGDLQLFHLTLKGQHLVGKRGDGGLGPGARDCFCPASFYPLPMTLPVLAELHKERR